MAQTAGAGHIEVRAARHDGTLTLAVRDDGPGIGGTSRGSIVRLDAVAELVPWFHGDYGVVMKDGATLTWSRRHRVKAGPARGQAFDAEFADYPHESVARMGGCH